MKPVNLCRTSPCLNKSSNALVADDFRLNDFAKDQNFETDVTDINHNPAPVELFNDIESFSEKQLEMLKQYKTTENSDWFNSDYIFPLSHQTATSKSRNNREAIITTTPSAKKKVSKIPQKGKSAARSSSPIHTPCVQRSNPKQTKNCSPITDHYSSPPLPSINERLGQLRPSRELLEFYRKKIAEYDDEHNNIVVKVDTYKDTYEETSKLQWELRQREDEIVELQKALSDMQVYLFQEKEHVLRLYAENDRLKLRELEDKQKIQQLLVLGSYPDGEVTYFHKEPPAKAITQQKYSKKVDNAVVAGGRTDGKKKSSQHKIADENYQHDNKILSLQIECLQAQLEEQTKTSKENIESLIADRSVKEEELEARKSRDEDKIRILLEKLQKTQDLLYDSTKDFLQQRYIQRSNERKWMAEKDELLQQLDKIQDFLQNRRPEIIQVKTTSTGVGTGQRPQTRNAAHQIVPTTVDTYAISTQYSEPIDPESQEEIKNLEFELQQTQKMSEMYREQAISMEEELSKIREEGDVTREIFKERSHKMSKRLQLMNTRYQELEKRRHFEVEGFKNDIKNLRSRLKDVERQLYKVTLGLAEELDEKRPDDLDLKILRNVRLTTGRSQIIMGELKNLKSKVYSLENDLRQL